MKVSVSLPDEDVEFLDANARSQCIESRSAVVTTGLRTDSKAQAEQVRAVAVERIGARIGAVPAEPLAALDEALRLHLAL